MLESFWYILVSFWCMLGSFWQRVPFLTILDLFWYILGSLWGHFGVCWGHFGNFGVIWGARLEPKVGLEAWWAPWLPQGVPRGPLGAQGCHFGRFGGHFGVIFDVKIMPKSTPKFIVFSSVDFVGFWCVSGCIFVTMFVVVRGLQRQIAKTLDM